MFFGRGQSSSHPSLPVRDWESCLDDISGHDDDDDPLKTPGSLDLRLSTKPEETLPTFTRETDGQVAFWSPHDCEAREEESER